MLGSLAMGGRRGSVRWARSSCRRGRAVVLICASACEVVEAGELARPGESHRSGDAVALLGHDQLGDSFFVGVRVVELIPIHEADHVGVLLDAAGVAEVGRHRALIGAALAFTVELRQHDDGNLKLFGKLLEPRQIALTSCSFERSRPVP